MLTNECFFFIPKEACGKYVLNVMQFVHIDLSSAITMACFTKEIHIFLALSAINHNGIVQRRFRKKFKVYHGTVYSQNIVQMVNKLK